MKLRQLWLLAALMLGLLQGAHATPLTFTFDTAPSGGAASGQPGQLLGWGYQLVNTDTSNWLVLTQLSASSISLGTPDASYFDFPILAPGAAASAGFDAALSGLYGLLLSGFAVPGQSDSGEFALAGEWWDGDPFAGGRLIQAAGAVTTPFAISVVAAEAIPLPGTLPLLLAGGLPLLWLGRRQRAAQRRAQPGQQVGLGLR